MTDEPTLSLEQALAAQRAMRDALGLGEERFPLPAFVGMVSDEVEQMRAAGHSDQDIVALIGRSTGQAISAETLQRYYAPPEHRR